VYILLEEVKLLFFSLISLMLTCATIADVFSMIKLIVRFSRDFMSPKSI